jgi:protein-S-isoprenylcysteine O-methyltransferase Ste14
MPRWLAAGCSAAFFLLAPGLVAGVVPWWLTGWDARDPWLPLQVVGGVVTAAGVAVLLHAFARFVVEGAGTPAPVAPTERLVVGGLYCHVRNPMYVAVVSVVAGQALVLGRYALLAYGAGLLALFVAFVRGYEEPVLSARYGAEYDAYRRAVPGWWPRPRAWRG